MSPMRGCLSCNSFSLFKSLVPTLSALAKRSSSSITSKTALAIAIETGLPPYWKKEKGDSVKYLKNYTKIILYHYIAIKFCNAQIYSQRKKAIFNIRILFFYLPVCLYAYLLIYPSVRIHFQE